MARSRRSVVTGWARKARKVATAAGDKWLDRYMGDCWDAHASVGTGRFGRPEVDELLIGAALLMGLTTWVHDDKTPIKVKVARLMKGKTLPQMFAASLTDDEARLIEDRAMVIADRLSGTIQDGRGTWRTLVEREELDRLHWTLVCAGRTVDRLLRATKRLDEVGVAWVTGQSVEVTPFACYILRHRVDDMGEWWAMPVRRWAWIDGKATYLSIIDAIGELENGADPEHIAVVGPKG